MTANPGPRLAPLTLEARAPTHESPLLLDRGETQQ